MVVSSIEKEISMLFRHEVDRQSLNQREMAKALNMSPQLLSHVLNGRRSAGLERTIEINDYLQELGLDFKLAAAIVHTPQPLQRKRRDSHPLSKMVGQDKEEMQRIDKEKRYEIWDLLSIDSDEIKVEEKNEIIDWLIELEEEIASEIAVFISVCDRYGLDGRKIIQLAESKERND